MMETEDLMREFLAAFETKDASRLGEFFHEEIVFSNYGDPDVRGKTNVTHVSARAFPTFETYVSRRCTRQSTAKLSSPKNSIIWVPGGARTTPIRNMAVYEIRDGLIGAWRSYTDSRHSGELLVTSKPIAAYQWGLKSVNAGVTNNDVQTSMS